MTEKIENGVVASLHVTWIVDGETFDRTEPDEPLEYLHGHNNIVPGLEKALVGKSVGDRVQVTLEPQDAYGEYNENDIQHLDRSEFEVEVVPGMVIALEFDDGELVEGIIKDVTDDAVIVDFNDELAGKTVTFDVEVVGIRPADAEELEHGHPHSYDDYLDEIYDLDDDEDE